MYTSAVKTIKVSDPIKKTVRIYLAAALFTAVLGHVYEHFSHGVYARGMFWAFLIPLIGGAALFGALSLIRPDAAPRGMEAALYHSGLCTLTVGSLFKGALDIYGTESGLSVVYTAAGVILISACAILYIARRARTA